MTDETREIYKRKLYRTLKKIIEREIRCESIKELLIDVDRNILKVTIIYKNGRVEYYFVDLREYFYLALNLVDYIIDMFLVYKNMYDNAKKEYKENSIIINNIEIAKINKKDNEFNVIIDFSKF